MTMYKKILLATVLAAPGALIGATQAQAQTVAVADLDAAVSNSKAFQKANGEIQTSFKTQLDQAQARRAAIQKELEPLLLALDTNKDGQLSQAELEAAQRANRPEVAQIQQKQAAGSQEVGRLEQPAVRAQQYAIEQISGRLNAAVQSAIAKRSVSVLLKPSSLIFVQPTADITGVITAELDASVPSVSITPPAGWQPGQQGQQAAAAPAAQQPATSAKPKKQPESR
jgi:Skp family chaperone for outer membrane proteins